MGQLFAGKPSNKAIIGVAALLLGDVLFGIAIHKILTTGTCSTTGYTSYGPVPHCPKGVGWYSAFLFGGVLLTFVAAATVGMFAVPALFIAMGVGALMVGFESSNSSGGLQTFSYVFGGCFLVAGVAWAGISGAYAWNNRPIRGPSVQTSPVPAVAGLGTGLQDRSERGLRITPRPLVALLVWIAAVGGAIGLGKLVASASSGAKDTTAAGTATTGTTSTGSSAPAVDITREALPRPPGADVVGATDPRSLFKGPNLAAVIRELTNQFGSKGSVIQLTLYPGELDAVIADDSGAAHKVTADPLRRLTVSAPMQFSGTRDAITVSQLLADVPPKLAQRIAASGGVPTGQLDRFVLDTSLEGALAGWRIYPRNGPVYFDALLTGDGLEKVTPTGKQSLA